jgi:glycosyltransferase involved in cell wall biosynthesis
MKILVIAPTPFFADRGTHIRILEEALALEKRGHNVIIATYHIGNDVKRKIRTDINTRRILKLLFWYRKLEPGPDWQKIFLDIMLIRKTFFLARTEHPDILHGHIHEGVLIGWIVKKLLFWRKMKLVADFHGSLVKEMESHGYIKNLFLKIIFGFLEKKIDRLGDFAIASSWENTEAIKKFRIKGKIETVPDGVNLDHYQKMPSKEELKKELEIPAGKIVVVYTGALVENKGVGYLLESIKKITASNKGIFFIIGGYPVEYIENYITQNDLKNFVRMISPLSYFELPKILLASDIGIDPKDITVNQASGKILQYMAAGLPVVCFDKKNNREYLGDGAYYSQDFTSTGIADGILYFFKNQAEIKKKGDYNKERIKSFSWDKSAEKIEGIYRKIL